MHYHLEAEIAELKASLELALGRWRESQDRIMQLTQDRDTLKQALDVAVKAIEKSKCDEVINYDGSGMFNRHDANCKKCKAITSINEIINKTKQGE